ncbi:hypothetical protein P3S67_003428 [Capsicum chacoense]
MVENDRLCQIPEEQEIKEAVFSLSATSAAGPNGFNETFFQSCWDIIKEDIKAYVQEFFKGLKTRRSPFPVPFHASCRGAL